MTFDMLEYDILLANKCCKIDFDWVVFFSVCFILGSFTLGSNVERSVIFSFQFSYEWNKLAYLDCWSGHS